MPFTTKQLPKNGSSVRFRRSGEKILRTGKYENNEFQSCSSFICVSIDEVDYWRYNNEKTQPKPPT